MRKVLGTLTALMLVGQAATAADIYVRDAEGADLGKDQVTQVTDAVKRSVRGMPEHNLVMSEAEADFVLKPSIIQDGETMSLRIEKEKDGQTLALSEEQISSVNASGDRAVAATQTAMDEDLVASGSESASTTDESIASDASPETDETIATDDTTSTTIGTERNVTTSPTEDVGSGTLGDDTAVSEEGTMSGTTTDATGASDSSDESTMETSSDTSAAAIAPTTNTAAADSSAVPGGDVRAPSPRLQDPNRAGFFQIGAGPSFSAGLDSDVLMYNIFASYNRTFTPRIDGKVFTDFHLGQGTDAARMINLGVGGDFYVQELAIPWGTPYVTGDIGFAFVRDEDDDNQNAAAVGAGLGFKASTQALNWDVNLHYSLLTTELDGKVPSFLGVRAALNF